MAVDSSPCDVVAMVGSAGGIRAMEHVLEQLPADLGAAVVIVLHLTPLHRSLLAEILARRTELSVKQAEDGDELQIGAVYVAPPDAHLLATADGRLQLDHSELVHHVRPSADALLLSLAGEYRGRCLAIVLSGTGIDGAAGAAAIKHAGGTVLAQDEATSEHFGMPGAAILAGGVDEVLPVDQIARAVIEFAEGRGMNDVDHDFERLLEYVRDARGFDYTHYRRPTLMRRVEKRLQAVGAADWTAYQAYLGNHPEEFGELFNAILINVTGFFRDKETWDLVASDVIPKLLERKPEGASIRVWSAGCASGEEPYTIAMVLAEAVGEEAFKERVRIYATDVDDDALVQAREATYTSRDLGEVPEELRDRYFQPAKNGFAFRTDLRRSVIFGRNDLISDPPISRVDLLVSRNTLMYFSPDAQERILANFYFALSRNGFLVVGRAEALQSGRKLFVPHNLKRRVFMKDGAAEQAFRIRRLPAPLQAPGDDSGSRELGDAAFEHGPIAQLVIDEKNHIVAVNHAARAMFGLKLKDAGRKIQDLEISYRPVDLRTLIDSVRNRHTPVSENGVLWQPAKGEARSLDIEVAQLLGPGDRPVGVSVSFLDVTSHRTLEEHLERARRELESAYEELQSTVEELETTNEELQSTNEELETTNEELQSTNEELETMNEELQSTNEELETMNDELRERTEETLHANMFLGSVLSSIDEAVVVVDDELQIVAWNQLATELWGLRDDEVEGRHLLNLDIGLPVAKLRDPLRRVLAGEATAGIDVEGHNRRGQPVIYGIRLAPFDRRGENASSGGAILLITTSRTN